MVKCGKKSTFLFLCPLKVKAQASEDKAEELVFFRSQSFKELSVEAVTTVSASINFT